MRTRAALLIAAFVIIVVATSALVTSHFGMRDWPTPPLPDTATRLITPSEAAGRAGDRATREDEGSGTPVAGAKTGRRAHAGQPRRTGSAPRRAGERLAAAPRGNRTGRRANGRSGSRGGARGAVRTPAAGPTPAAPSPPPSTPPVEAPPAASTPAPAAPTPAVPVVSAGSGDNTQARPHDVPVQAPAAPEPQAGGGPGSGTGSGPATGPVGDHPGAGPAPGGRRGPIRTLLDALL